MHVGDWVSVITMISGMIGVGTGAIVKLTRLVDAVEHLAETLKEIMGKVADHEGRIRDLEHPVPPGWYGPPGPPR